MKENTVKWIGYLFSFIFLIVSCAGTDLTETRVGDAYRGQPVSNILVIAVTGNEHNRRSYERKFVAHLKSAGVEAVASEKSIPMPGDLKLKKEPILNAVDQYKNDAVIITQLVGKAYGRYLPTRRCDASWLFRLYAQSGLFQHTHEGPLGNEFIRCKNRKTHLVRFIKHLEQRLNRSNHE